MATVTSMTFNILASRKENVWTAHCLELDIVAEGKTFEDVKTEIIELIKIQIDYAFSNDNLDNLYHPAPQEVWQVFFTCKKAEADKVKMESKYSNNTFIPPWIIANTCTAGDSAIA